MPKRAAGGAAAGAAAAGAAGAATRGNAAPEVFDGLAGMCELWPVAVERPPRVFSRESLREMDRLAKDEFGMPTALLMENAGASLAAHAKRLLAFDAEHAAGSAFGAIIVAGKGNNGGDGFVMARHLANAGWRVAIVLAASPESYKDDAAMNLRICERMQIGCVVATEGSAASALEKAQGLLAGDQAERTPRVDLIVDALLGTGLSGAVRGVARELIDAVNGRRGVSGVVGGASNPGEGDSTEARKRADVENAVPAPLILAVDIPSGMDAETGGPAAAGSPVVNADLTVSLVGLKPGYLALEAQRYLGQVVIAEIGMPRELVTRFGREMEAGVRPGDRGSDRTDAGRRAYRPGE